MLHHGEKINPYSPEVLVKMSAELSFCSTHLEFATYKYPPASIYPSGKVHSSDIANVGINCFPPEIRLRTGEIIFVPAPEKERLRDWSQQNEIQMTERVDVWSLLLEPFLDTQFSDQDQVRTLQTLKQCGFTETEVASIREQVNDIMVAYNFDSMLWEWVHLGQTDLLDAYAGMLVPSSRRMSPAAFRDFYWRTMEIANRAG